MGGCWPVEGVLVGRTHEVKAGPCAQVLDGVDLRRLVLLYKGEKQFPAGGDLCEAFAGQGGEHGGPGGAMPLECYGLVVSLTFDESEMLARGPLLGDAERFVRSRGVLARLDDSKDRFACVVRPP